MLLKCRQLKGFMLIIILCVSSCSKDEAASSNQSVASVLSYMPLALGNYWVYEVYEVDTLGTRVYFGIDSARVKRIEVRNGRNYAVIEEKSYLSQEWNEYLILSDSADYLINQAGVVLLAPFNFEDTLYHHHVTISPTDTVMEIYYNMVKLDTVIRTPSGEYSNALEYKATVFTYNPEPGIKNPRYFGSVYAKNVGLVFSSYGFWKRSHRIEKRLIRYSTNF